MNLHRTMKSAAPLKTVLSALMMFLSLPALAASEPQGKVPLALRAEVIARGQVVGTRSSWEGGLIVTHVTLRVESCVKGECNQGLEYDTAGGRMGNLEQILGEEKPPSAGDRLEVYLTPRAHGGLRPA